ncbi:LacI family DNA-binding transcriptional regulator [Actinomadura madurae]|uniref:LacI family DNA-binding transcriptional regulator n=1 Tax=Actinomadura madurae TaxID=1993 RepID=UPI0020D20BB8|nr:LacI family DNA-binding transcriptional regulator [Actinomadura madurae]MCP9951060.1 LacI family transcriptional regulator [Actinomadura madurae]MCP9980296.1 LacI family transcriptional regulator [Actinomadura madurae]MCQ0008185.1 LacI family transcriptional regulator [Actinomadura madurae]MCQ0016505.1 LacI family transcriptional regulator [Actinomadura madurae]
MTTKPPAKRSGLKAVAALAGVSVQTVSNVVNARVGEMSTETRLRVEKAMRDLNYTPNSQARGLRIQKTNTLAFLLLDPDERYLADPMTDLIISGVGAVARERGYMVLVHAAKPGDFDSGLLLPIRQNRVDGALLLLCGDAAVRRRYTEETKQLTSNLVVFEDLDDPSVNTVTAQNRVGAYDMTMHLIDKGHRRIAFLGTATPWPMIEQRFAGYQEALKERGIAFDPGLTLFEGEWNADTGAQMAARIRAHPEPPTAIIAGNDLLAIGAIAKLKAEGLRVPEDVSVIGFNDFEFAQHTDPPLTTVRVPGFEMGHRAATILIEQIDGKQSDPTSEHLPVEQVLRASA